MFRITVTDTFGGEANYSWVRHYKLDMPASASDRAVVRAAKKLAGWAGIRSKTSQYGGDTLWVRPIGACMVMIVTWEN